MTLRGTSGAHLPGPQRLGRFQVSEAEGCCWPVGLLGVPIHMGPCSRPGEDHAWKQFGPDRIDLGNSAVPEWVGLAARDSSMHGYVYGGPRDLENRKSDDKQSKHSTRGSSWSCTEVHGVIIGQSELEDRGHALGQRLACEQSVKTCEQWVPAPRGAVPHVCLHARARR